MIAAARAWTRQSTGGIVDGRGWEIHRDTPGACDEAQPWSLWHHGEYVNNYATVVDAKADAVPVDCSRCDSVDRMPAVGDSIPACIQIGHYGAHIARPECLVIDAYGRCQTPRTTP